MSLTPTIRDFLVKLEDQLDREPPPGLERGAMTVTTGDAAALVRLPHVAGHEHDVEIEIDDRRVVVGYPPERIVFTSADEALRFVGMLCAGRVVLEITHGLLWTTMRSYRDGQTIPFRRTRMPWPTLRPRTERRAVGFGS
ncbi:MAG TPA: hypothetical protein VGP92_03200 [Acidimicrobiia bacterium]|nr:hypothetical protein [Acidimicrobiia bacterium]